MANRCWLNRIRGILLPASSVHHFLAITSARYSFHCIRRNLLHPLRGSHGVFLSDLVRVRHDNAFFSCPSPRRCCICLSHIVSDSDVCASVSVSCSRSCLLTSTGFRSCGVPPESILLSSGFATLSICFPSHVSHIALFPEVSLASAPVPVCSKIWDVCFDVNTVLDDPPINSGGATHSRHCSLPGGATRTRHDDAISDKRLTMPCGSDFLCHSDPRCPRIGTRSSAVFSHNAQYSFLGQIFCCPMCVPTCMQRFRVCLASVQTGFLPYRWFHCWRAFSGSFPGCPARHAASMFHRYLVSPSPS